MREYIAHNGLVGGDIIKLWAASNGLIRVSHTKQRSDGPPSGLLPAGVPRDGHQDGRTNHGSGPGPAAGPPAPAEGVSASGSDGDGSGGGGTDGLGGTGNGNVRALDRQERLGDPGCGEAGGGGGVGDRKLGSARSSPASEGTSGPSENAGAGRGSCGTGVIFQGFLQ